MKKVIVTVGMTEKNYSAHVNIGEGIAVATGKTFDELKKQMSEAIEFHLEGMREDGDKIPAVFGSKYELVYHFSTESLLRHYSGIFTNAAFQRLTGINQRQVQRYVSGESKPREAQVRKIELALHNLGRELLAVEL
ncbi:MAG: type II toxin-antitoxin system HicB family antitoxin [Culturomica sp.]|jgi:predicted RNase H-like HicB family nuclease|nr:type II toxin-antitoxin system HicB family antitoxin [Culturomica sp.]